MGKRSRFFSTLQCGLFEAVSFGHFVNLSDGQYGWSFLEIDYIYDRATDLERWYVLWSIG